MVQFHYNYVQDAEAVLAKAQETWASSGDVLEVADDYGSKARFDIGEVACCFITDLARELEAQAKVQEAAGGSNLVLPKRRAN